MKRLPTISLETVKTALRRGGLGSVENVGGWCVFVAASGERFFVFDEAAAAAVPYRAIGSIASVGSLPGSQPLSPAEP